MEKKATIISLIFISLVVISAAALIIFSGITAREYNYVQLEINPRVEFLCDKKFKVVSTRALNEDAQIALAGVEYKGLDINIAATDFIDICARMGYIDVDGADNALNITVIDGITQALDAHIVEHVYKFLRSKEILCVVVENYEDRSMYDAKKENKIACANKYKLIKTITEYDSSATLDELKKLNEIELIDIVSNIHSTSDFSPTQEDITNKTKLVDFNRVKYNNHMRAISNNSQRQFAEVFADYQALSSKKYFENFNEQYTNWQERHSL